MTVIKLESRPVYSIGTVARLTGIKPDTLRVWERRYGLGASQKSAGGHRVYTQSDLEHLQIISGLIEQGTRIGDIANRERRTLEMMSLERHKSGKKLAAEYKPKFLFIGEQLAQWIDEHPGCISNIRASIARRSIPSILETQFEAPQNFDAVVVECPTLDSDTKQLLDKVKNHTNAGRVIACHPSAPSRWVEELQISNVTLMTLPPNPLSLGHEINRCIVEGTSCIGDTNTRELAAAKPRYFTPQQLEEATAVNSQLHCACPNHLSKLIEALNEFEDYSSQCAVDSWHETAVHSCVYAYTSQARWLMEKALRAVLEEEDSTPLVDRALQ